MSSQTLPLEIHEVPEPHGGLRLELFVDGGRVAHARADQDELEALQQLGRDRKTVAVDLREALLAALGAPHQRVSISEPADDGSSPGRLRSWYTCRSGNAVSTGVVWHDARSGRIGGPTRVPLPVLERMGARVQHRLSTLVPSGPPLASKTPPAPNAAPKPTGAPVDAAALQRAPDASRTEAETESASGRKSPQGSQDRPSTPRRAGVPAMRPAKGRGDAVATTAGVRPWQLPMSSIARREDELEDDSARAQGETAILQHVLYAMGTGLVPVPLADVGIVCAVQLDMLRVLCTHYDVAFNEKLGAAIASSLASSCGAVLIAPVVASSLMKFIPGLGTGVGAVSMAVLAGASTYALGRVFLLHLETGGDLDDFDAKQARRRYRREFKQGQAVVERLRTKGAKPEGAGRPRR